MDVGGRSLDGAGSAADPAALGGLGSGRDVRAGDSWRPPSATRFIEVDLHGNGRTADIVPADRWFPRRAAGPRNQPGLLLTCLAHQQITSWPIRRAQPGGMPTHVALLRGVNLGKRAGSTAEFEEAARRELELYRRHSTHVQSGNAVLTSKTNESRIAAKLEAEPTKAFGFAVPVIERSRAGLADVVRDYLFPDAAADPTEAACVVPREATRRAWLGHLADVNFTPEGFVMRKREVYLPPTQRPGTLEARRGGGAGIARIGHDAKLAHRHCTARHGEPLT